MLQELFVTVDRLTRNSSEISIFVSELFLTRQHNPWIRWPLSQAFADDLILLYEGHRPPERNHRNKVFNQDYQDPLKTAS